MDDSYYSSPGWNTSFEDNDASTTLDTSLESASDSMVDKQSGGFKSATTKPFQQTSKLHTSRSSPTRPFDKDVHKVRGYFDDVESFTSAAMRLQYDGALSPLSLPNSLQLSSLVTPHHTRQKRSSIDTATPGDGEIAEEPPQEPAYQGSSLEEETPVVSDDACQQQQVLDSPVSGIAVGSGFLSSRRGTRSHTSQGIPTAVSFHGRHCVNEDISAVNEEKQAALKEENETLRTELDSTRNRLAEMEKRMSIFSAQLDLGGHKDGSATMGGGVGLHGPVAPVSAVLNVPVPNFAPGGAVAGVTSPPYVDALGQMTPDSASVTSMSMTPDSLSPFQRMHPSFAKGHGLMTPAEITFAGSHAYGMRQTVPTPRGGGGGGGKETVMQGMAPSAGRIVHEHHGRPERSSRTALQEVQVPVELLIAKTLGARSQDASITLQQQLKTGLPARKAAIIEGMSSHVVRLSEDKHGNFLVQRAIGVDSSVASELRGHYVDLSLSQFGCHVVQRVLDESSLQAIVVKELLAERVLDTLTCRNSIHVWQKVLEINWAEKAMRRNIFTTVNSVMKGRWAETAMQETGSIICQNIFESADADEKSNCVSEILDRLCECAANQWGVWVVQHIIEHGEGDHRKAAFDQLLGSAVHLTLSQYGQKAIMSALKSCDAHFIEAYIELLCPREGVATPTTSQAPALATANSRRSVLVDISSAPQGVQIITQLLTSVQPAQRDRIIKTVRKNSVFLKGSKAGLRVHQLCERARAFTGY